MQLQKKKSIKNMTKVIKKCVKKKNTPEKKMKQNLSDS